MMTVCILWLFLGFLLLIIKLRFALTVDGTSLLDRRDDVLVPNYELLFQLYLLGLAIVTMIRTFL